MKNLLWVAVCLFFAPPCVRGGIGTIRGSEWELWTKDRYCVIVCTVEGIVDQPRGDPGPTHQLNVVPMATLAGQFDPTETRAMSFFLYAGVEGTSIRTVPPVGATIMAVVCPGILVGENEVPSNWVVSDICRFMPQGSAICVVKDLNDPQILRTIERIREARANPDPDPYRTAASRPTTAPARKP